MNGVLVIDKPAGFTSFDVVACLRRACRQKKMGHTGTLDPMATGVLPLLLGSATKAAELLPDHDKTYLAGFALGSETDTQDSSGKVLRSGGRRVMREELEQVLEQFRGEILQVPPMYSAVSVGGQRLYSLARQGVTVEREARPVTIYRLELCSFDEREQTGELLVECSKGTYIRTLCADIGETLRAYGIMTSLRRTRACGFTLEDALPLEEARAMKTEALEARVLPTEKLFIGLRGLVVTPAQAVRFSNGGALALDRLRFSGKSPESGERFRVCAPGGKFLGLGETTAETGELRVLRLFPGDSGNVQI